jgi:hypothetical protein
LRGYPFRARILGVPPAQQVEARRALRQVLPPAAGAAEPDPHRGPRPWPTTAFDAGSIARRLIQGDGFGLRAEAPADWRREFLGLSEVATERRSGARLYTGAFLNPGFTAADWAEHCATRLASFFTELQTRHDLTPVPRPGAPDAIAFEISGTVRAQQRHVRLLCYTISNEDLVACHVCWGEPDAFASVEALVRWLGIESFKLSVPTNWRQIPAATKFDTDTEELLGKQAVARLTVTPLDDSNDPTFKSPFGFAEPQVPQPGTPVTPPDFHDYVHHVVTWEEQFGLEDVFAKAPEPTFPAVADPDAPALAPAPPPGRTRTWQLLLTLAICYAVAYWLWKGR